MHSQDIGWGPTLTSGAAGTIGKRAEALRFKVSAPGISGDVSYRAHVQDIGWMSPSTSANAIGTSGRGLRMEAFQISLTGELATRYSVRYRAYVRGIGWQAWVTDGATAGTTGQGRQIEAIETSLDLAGEKLEDWVTDLNEDHDPVAATTFTTSKEEYLLACEAFDVEPYPLTDLEGY